MLQFFLDNELKPFLKGNIDHIFSQIFSLNGEVFRLVKNRKTFRFSYNQKNYFVKIHRGVGWKEIFKCLLQGKRPVLSAENEYRAIRHLEQLNIPTMTCRAFALRGSNPAEMESFLITDELQNVVSLEDYTKDWINIPPPSSLKHRIIEKLAEICAKMHFSGLNHRDCYICHFLLDTMMLENNNISLVVLDLHRAEIRLKIPRRMRVKDLAGIFFSSMDAGLNKRDALRFIAKYSSFGKLDKNLWKDVLSTAVKLYKKEWKKDPILPEK